MCWAYHLYGSYFRTQIFTVVWPKVPFCARLEQFCTDSTVFINRMDTHLDACPFARMRVPAGSSSCDRHVAVHIFNINQPSLPTPFYFVLVSISVFVVLSRVFHSINSPDNSPLSHSVLPVLSLPYWSFQPRLFMKVSFSPDVIPSGRRGSKHQLTN